MHRNLRNFQEKITFKDFSGTPRKIQGLFKTVQTLEYHSRKYAPVPITTLEAGYAENGNGNAITIYVTQRT